MMDILIVKVMNGIIFKSNGARKRTKRRSKVTCKKKLNENRSRHADDEYAAVVCAMINFVNSKYNLCRVFF